MKLSWPEDLDLSEVASPSLLVDADRVLSNIQLMIDMVGGDPWRLRPHVKTHKMSRVIQLYLAAGVDKFKAATIAEAEMVAKAGGSEVLIAYPMVGPNVGGLANLIDRYPATEFSTVVDHHDMLAPIRRHFADRANPISLLIDVDCGMHRTGIALGAGLDHLRKEIESTPGMRYGGLHVYDGHLHEPSLKTRQAQAEAIIAAVRSYERDHPSPLVVGGGSPTFAFWAQQAGWQCSPGTPVFWDVGYGTSYPDLDFSIAIALVTRVVSKPSDDRICLDLGYKSVASEMPLGKRVLLPSLPDAMLLGHSEEHLVIGTKQAESIPLGQALLAFPQHVCPTIALHGHATVVRGGKVTDEQWGVDARGR